MPVRRTKDWEARWGGGGLASCYPLKNVSNRLVGKREPRFRPILRQYRERNYHPTSPPPQIPLIQKVITQISVIRIKEREEAP